MELTPTSWTNGFLLLLLYVLSLLTNKESGVLFLMGSTYLSLKFDINLLSSL